MKQIEIRHLAIVAVVPLVGPMSCFAQSVTDSGFESPIEGALQNQAETPPQQEIARVVEQVCPSSNNGLDQRAPVVNSDFQARCNEIATDLVGEGRNGASGRDGLQAMAPEEDSVVRASSIDVNGGRYSDVSARIASLRSGMGSSMSLGVNGHTVDEKTLFGSKQYSGGGSAGLDDSSGFSQLGVFANFNYGWGDKDSTSRESGFDFDSYGVTVGADYRPLDNAIVGAAFRYGNTDAELNNDGGSSESDSYSFSVYGSYYLADKIYVDGIAGGGFGDFDLERGVRYSIADGSGGTTNVNQTASADPDSNHAFVSLTTGYNMDTNGWAVGPYGRFDYNYVDVDGYKESMSNPNAAGSGLGVEIDDQSYTSITFALGGRVSKAISTPWGVLMPQFEGEWIHEFDNDNESIAGRFLGDTSGESFFLSTDKPDRNYGVVGGGISAILAKGRSAFVHFQSLIGYEDVSSHQIEVGVRLEL